MSFRLAVSAEMVFVDLPFLDRVHRIDELGLEVEIWDWTKKDIAALAATGATFSSMTGYITGTLADPDGADELLRTAEQSLKVAEQLNCPRLNVHGTGLDDKGLPVIASEVVSPAMWLTAARTLGRLAETVRSDRELLSAAYVAELAAFVGAVRDGTPAPVGGEDARSALEIAVAAAQSVESGRPVLIDELAK